MDKLRVSVPLPNGAGRQEFQIAFSSRLDWWKAVQLPLPSGCEGLADDIDTDVPISTSHVGHIFIKSYVSQLLLPSKLKPALVFPEREKFRFPSRQELAQLSRERRAEQIEQPELGDHTVRSHGYWWMHLRKLIICGLSNEDIKRMGEYSRTQGALLLRVASISGISFIRQTSDLDKCSADEFLKLLQKIESRDFRDVLWVTESEIDKLETPWLASKSKDAVVLQWDLEAAKNRF